MAYKYFPHTDEDIRDMLDKIGVPHLSDLWKDIPAHVRWQQPYDLPHAKSEIEIRNYFNALTKHHQSLVCFAGDGVYDHYSPAVIPAIINRSEYLTSYTPYQAEISQGTLHYIFEYQSMMAALTGMDVSNASMYDGTTATAEAALMAVAANKKARTILISETVDERTTAVVHLYCKMQQIEVLTISAEGGVTSLKDLQTKLDKGGIAGVITAQPNKYGIIENYSGFAESCHAAKSLFIMNSIAADLALLKTPGEWGADIAVGDGQSLGIPMNCGGPYVGYLCCTDKLVRKMPGRVVGMTHDSKGQRSFVLTLQAREQHIRREKATSNICSNQSLMALYVTVYLSIMGKEGFKEAAQLSYSGAHYMQEKMVATGHFKLSYAKPYFNEFVLDYDGDAKCLADRLKKDGYLIQAVNTQQVKIAVTEQRTKEEIDQLIALI